MHVKRETLGLDFIAGLIVGEGTFYWTRTPEGKLPAFGLRMHVRDKWLVTAVRDTLGLKHRVYEYAHNKRHYVFLLVREIGPLKNTVIPLIYPRLLGYKRLQFLEWFKNFHESDIAEWFQFFPNALRRQFPKLCSEQMLNQMIEREKLKLSESNPLDLKSHDLESNKL